MLFYDDYIGQFLMRGSCLKSNLQPPSSSFALLFIAGPVTRIQSVSGMLTNLPCNITPSSPTDRVNIVLWYKDGLGKPLYR